MPEKLKNRDGDLRTEQGRQLASRLYDLKLAQLEHLTPADRTRLQSEFPHVTDADLQTLLAQVIEAKRLEQERVGWQAVPHDVAVLVTVLVTALVDLRTGAVAGIATLVLLESLFQFYFHRALYRALSTLVWFTYPAYAVLVYLLLRRGMPRLWVAVAALLTWAGSFLLGLLARLPVRLILEARAQSAASARKHTPAK
jgi:hypothetical protein